MLDYSYRIQFFLHKDLSQLEPDAQKAEQVKLTCLRQVGRQHCGVSPDNPIKFRGKRGKRQAETKASWVTSTCTD